MKRKFLSLLSLLAALLVMACAQKTQPTAPANQTQAATNATAATPAAAPRTQLKVGDPAPDFTLANTKGEQVKLSDFKGKKNVVLAFYVLAFTGG